MGRKKLNRTREELIEQKRVRDARYYVKHGKRIKKERMRKYWKKWTKKCPDCGREQIYTNKYHLKNAIEKTSLKSKDVIRMNNIIKNLNCRFFRYNERKNELLEYKLNDGDCKVY